MEIQQRDQVFNKGDLVVDLGAAPGSWSQLAVEYISKTGKVIAVDLLPILPIVGVDLINGDFTEQQTIDQIEELLNNQKIDLIICDMAPKY